MCVSTINQKTANTGLASLYDIRHWYKEELDVFKGTFFLSSFQRLALKLLAIRLITFTYIFVISKSSLVEDLARNQLLPRWS